MTLPPELWSEPILAKHVVFVALTIGFLAVAIPLAIKHAWMDRVCMAGIWFMAINPVKMTLFSYTLYRGDIRGLEFGVTDWLAITMVVAMHKAPRWQKRTLYTRNPNEVWLALYLAYCLFTISTALIPQFAVFGVSKIIRAYVTFWVAYNFIRSEDDLRFVIWTVVGMTFYSFIQVLLDKYTRGVFPPRGSFDHQNGLATFQNIMNFIIFAVLMQDSEKLFDKRSLIYWAGLGAGVLTSVATLSRGGHGHYGHGLHYDHRHVLLPETEIGQNQEKALGHRLDGAAVHPGPGGYIAADYPAFRDGPGGIRGVTPWGQYRRRTHGP